MPYKKSHHAQVENDAKPNLHIFILEGYAFKTETGNQDYLTSQVIN